MLLFFFGGGGLIYKPTVYVSVCSINLYGPNRVISDNSLGECICDVTVLKGKHKVCELSFQTVQKPQQVSKYGVKELLDHCFGSALSFTFVVQSTSICRH